jgi:sugar lactone lactonase YvrE
MNFIRPSDHIPAAQRHREAIPEYCRGLAIDQQGNIYVAATGNRCVVKVAPDGDSQVMMRCETPWPPEARPRARPARRCW